MWGQDIRKKEEVSEDMEAEKMKVADKSNLNVFIFYNFILI